ncbi:hypothetical protein GGI02_004545, partial [Coemansia sp. RSA 2322]
MTDSQVLALKVDTAAAAPATVAASLSAQSHHYQQLQQQQQQHLDINVLGMPSEHVATSMMHSLGSSSVLVTGASAPSLPSHV